MKQVNAIRYNELEEENQELRALLNLIKKQVELDEKLQLLIVAVANTGD